MKTYLAVLTSGAVLLAGCAAKPVKDGEKPTASVSTPKSNFITQRVISRYEWAVQHYEAGEYEKALKELRTISLEGPINHRFELVEYFQGMCLFHLSRIPEAAEKLEAFLQRAAKAYESQEARMTLLRAYELQGNWAKLASLASESDNETMYYENRALLKLLWAQALIQLGEHAGAERVLNETKILLNNVPPDYSGGNEGYDLRRELLGRYRWIYLSNKAHDCARKILPAKGKASLLPQWAEGYGECLVSASHDFFRDSRDLGLQWVEKSQSSLYDAWKAWLEQVKAQTAEKKASLALRQKVNAQVKRSFSRFLFLIQEERKSFQNQQDKDLILKRLAQNVEALLSEK